MRLSEEGVVPLTGEARSGYVIGITIFINEDGGLGLFENGLRQNILFLYRLFAAAPGCARVYLLNHGDGQVQIDPAAYGVRAEDIVRTQDVADQLDLVLLAGAAMDRETALGLRDRGCRLFAYKGGNGAVISMEAMIARPPRGDAERYFDHDLFSAVLLTPQHWRTFRGWCETLYRCPVREVPQIWSPLLIETARPQVRAGFGYQPGARPWRIGVMEPNITVMKTSHMPMLVCEAAYRAQPQALAAVYVTNGLAHAGSAHFTSFANSLSAVQAGVMTFEPRFVGVEFIAAHCDAVVTHHWENGLNYLYYEVLCGGYPLVHNSELLRDYGYYYDAFDAEAGARALLRAHCDHDAALASYREAATELIDRLNPRSSAMIRIHEALLDLG